MLPACGGFPDGALLNGGAVGGAAVLVTEGAPVALPAAGGAVPPETGAVALAEAGGVFVAAVSSVCDERRRSSQATIHTLMTSRATMATAQTGNRAFGGAPFTSNSAGPVCR